MNSTVPIPFNSVANRLGWFAGLLVAVLFPGTQHWVRAQEAADFTWGTSQNSITITGYQGPGGSVIVPAQINGLPVTEIGTAAFFGNTNLTQITLPDGIRDIENFAFHGCSNLKEVDLGQTLKKLDYGLFAGCVSLKELSIPDSVQYVSEQFSGHETLAFSDCRALRQVHLGRGLTEVRRGWAEFFATCPNLTAVSVADDHPAYRSIGGVLFSRDMTELVFIPRGQSGRYEVPASVVSLGFQSMRDCDNLEEVVLPEGLVSVGDMAFLRCTRLRHLALPNSVTRLGEYAFSGCTGLVQFSIPSQVTYIGAAAFSDCYKLISVRFHGNAPLGGEALGVWVPDGQLTVFYLPGTIGWGSDFGGVPTTLWLPAIRQPTVAVDQSRGSFGFAVDWAPYREVTVEACSDLAQRDWQRVGSLTLDAAGTGQFRDPDSSGRPTRLYRLRTP